MAGDGKIVNLGEMAARRGTDLNVSAVIAEEAHATRSPKSTIERRLRHLSSQAGKALEDAANEARDAFVSPYHCEVTLRVREWASDWQARKAAGSGLVLWGPVGTGKDTLAYRACRHLVKQGATIEWMNARQLAAQLRNAISAKESDDDVKLAIGAEVLLLSDVVPPFGVISDYQADTLYRIFESRCAHRRVSIVTLNIGSDEEADNRLGAPIWDRIKHRSWVLECAWPSFRNPALEMRRSGLAWQGKVLHRNDGGTPRRGDAVHG